MSWRETIARAWPPRWFEIPPTDLTAGELEAFRVKARALMARNTTPVALIVAAVVLAWWPLDPLVFRDTPRLIPIFGSWRPTLAAFLGGVLLAAHGTGLMARHPQPVAGVLVVGGFAITAWFMGRIGDVEERWFSYFLAAPMFTIPILVPLGSRVAINVGMLAATWAAFVAAEPALLTHPSQAPALSTYVFTGLFGVMVGHLAYLAQQAAWTAQRRLSASEAELRELTASLERRVQARTAQLRSAMDAAEGVQEHERAWIVRELHDALGQELSALQYGLRTLRERVGDAAAPNAFEPVQELLNRAAGTTRRILGGLGDAPPDTGELVARLRALVRDARTVGGLDATLSTDPGRLGALSGATRRAVLRIAQEATTNVGRHAKATRLHIRLARDEDGVALVVEDDGVGLPEAVRPGAMGLAGIRQRAAELGGRAAWRARDGGGTVLEVRLPCQT